MKSNTSSALTVQQSRFTHNLTFVSYLLWVIFFRTLHNVAPDNGQLEPDQSVYHQPAPGLDYTMQNRRETQPYNPHGKLKV